jgi:VanZ family protein
MFSPFFATDSKRTVWRQTIFSQKVLGWLTLLLVLAMSVACFWPFWTARNAVWWIAGGHGVAFGNHGVLVSPGPLRPGGIVEPDCTLDLWVESEQAHAKGAILAAYTPANASLLSVEQYEDGLAVRSLGRGGPTRIGGAELYADGVFAPGKRVLLTITSDGNGTKAFVNGMLRRAVPGFQICHALLTGSLVVGTAADSHDSWSGRVAGIAIFSRSLSAGEVQEAYNYWPDYPGPALGGSVGVAALYPFDDGSGRRVRDVVSNANSLYMPDRYLVVAKAFLSPPLFDNPADIVANIIGFIPLGFILCGYLSFRSGKATSVVMTVLLCGLFSLVVEMLQWFLPTRDSDMTDVITNIAGAAGGVLLYRLSRVWLAVPLRKGTQ